jgi:hypothetical protein
MINVAQNEHLLNLTQEDINNLPEAFEYNKNNEMIILNKNENGEYVSTFGYNEYDEMIPLIKDENGDYVSIKNDNNILKLIEIKAACDDFDFKIKGINSAQQFIRKALAEVYIKMIESLIKEIK